MLQPCLALVVIPSQKDAHLPFDVTAELLCENEDERDKNDEDNEVFTWLHETKTIEKDFLTNKKMSKLFLFKKDKKKCVVVFLHQSLLLLITFANLLD